MKPIKLFFLIITASVVISCANSKKDYEQAANAMPGGAAMELNMEGAPPSDKKAPTEASTQTEQKLIKNGSISFETKSIKDTKLFLQKAVLKYKGYISNEQIQDYQNNPTEVLTIRIPNANFDSMINDISAQVGEFDSKKIDIDDVTAEFVDIEARLKNKKQLETKYQELLAKTSNMADILKIEKEISIIREDIEATEGRLRYLSNQVGYSTLIITYYEQKPSAGFNFGSKLNEALQDGKTGFLWFLITLVRLWPMWLIGGSIWFLILKIKKTKKTKK